MGHLRGSETCEENNRVPNPTPRCIVGTEESRGRGDGRSRFPYSAATVTVVVGDPDMGVKFLEKAGDFDRRCSHIQEWGGREKWTERRPVVFTSCPLEKDKGVMVPRLNRPLGKGSRFISETEIHQTKP